MRRGMDTAWWFIMALVLAIVGFLIFYTFIRGGFTGIKTGTDIVFEGLK